MEYVFFTGMGRSGTKFLTSLLGKIKNVHAVHEYTGNREFWLLSWYLDASDYTIPFLEREKGRIEKKFGNGIFIDVNGYLQNSAPQLQSVFNPKKIFHLVRHPKHVVRSYYTRRNDDDIHQIPKTRLEIEKWMDGDKFYQVCWNWANTTGLLLQQGTQLLLFENLTTDYFYFKSNVLDALNLSLSIEDWEKAVTMKINSTRSKPYRWLYSKVKGKPFVEEMLPEFEAWPPDYKSIFYEICGPVMKQCGYE